MEECQDARAPPHAPVLVCRPWTLKSVSECLLTPGAVLLGISPHAAKDEFPDRITRQKQALAYIADYGSSEAGASSHKTVLDANFFGR